jgi:predicted transposase YbfD/YdcC
MKKNLSTYFDQVPDPRVTGRCLHQLSDLLLVSICTFLTGGSDYHDMFLLAKERGPALQAQGVLQLPNGTPSVDTFERIFQRLDIPSLQACLAQHGQALLGALAEKQIAIDGKKLRGASPTSKGNSGLYLLNAWVCENRICVHQERVEDKSNEAAAIPRMLDALDITDAVVTLDAAGTQKSVAEHIRRKGGHYLLAVKGNQQELLDDVECAFKVHHGVAVSETEEYDRTRLEKRRCSLLPAKDYLLEENLSQWKDLATLVKVEASRDINGVVSRETRYYISDEEVRQAAYYSSLVRGHWGIENHLHWHLDVTFNEDACRARKSYAPDNLSAIRKIALQLLTQAQDKYSLKKRQYKAALDMDYMLKLLEF